MRHSITSLDTWYLRHPILLHPTNCFLEKIPILGLLFYTTPLQKKHWVIDIKLRQAIGEAVMLGCVLSWIYILIIITYNGIVTGNYEFRIIIRSNVFYEHYFELVLLIVGLYFYIRYRRIRFKIRRKNIWN